MKNIYPQVWQKAEDFEEAKLIIQKTVLEMEGKRIKEWEADFIARNGEKPGPMYHRWFYSDVSYWTMEQLENMLGQARQYFDNKEFIKSCQDGFEKCVLGYLKQEREAALKGKGKTQAKIIAKQFDAWAKEVFPECVKIARLKFEKVNGVDNLKKIKARQSLKEILTKVEKSDYTQPKKLAIKNGLKLRYCSQIESINQTYSDLEFPKFGQKVQEMER